jgi:hypothetical protein
MAEACSTKGTRKMHSNFYLENLKRRYDVGDEGVDTGVMLKYILD